MSAMALSPHRHVTLPGGVLVCITCGAELELTCPNGHNPAEYLLEPDEQLAAAIGRAPRGKEPRQVRAPRAPRPPLSATQQRRNSVPPPPPAVGICEKCSVEFPPVKRRGRRHTRCENCR